ncbi:aminotransferase class V-fold PLP-dependent enzyme [Dyella sp. 333MFSha]|uniref:aminotransferase class V-fold PLP-dependent enzyme n=1 Tax=Dyella sp. 333MFSha TaxID=1798240 RepID=UPI000890F58C|nr:aminotransferase class V-fold PLP-dependent enzyme [Dyella sp. 333MFSha]SDG53759.1 Selenocysteine lyase/Cysteine desulfurase [Dyella sp. 333MFSha]
MSPAPGIPPIPRDALQLPADVLWLAHCKDGPIPRVAAEGVRALLETELEPWNLRWQEDFLDVQARLRHASAAFFAVDEADISLVACTSAGLEAISLGYPWQSGDEVLIPAGEFSSNRLPWLALSARGVVCREVELWPDQLAAKPAPPMPGIEPEQRLLDQITPHTRLMSVSWIRFQDGTRLDLDRLGQGCAARGVHLVVDGIQGAGTMVPSLTHVDAFVSGGHKGLLGTQGQGVMWTRSTFRQRLVPLGTWLSAPAAFSQSGTQADAGDLWASDGRRLEAGSPSILSCGALGHSVQLLLDSGGAPVIQAHVMALQRLLLERLLPYEEWSHDVARLQGLLEADRLGPTLSFRVEDDRAERLLAAAAKQKIGTSTREGYLRVALHGWHSVKDVERTVAWLTQVDLPR